MSDCNCDQSLRLAAELEETRRDLVKARIELTACRRESVENYEACQVYKRAFSAAERLIRGRT